MRRMAQALRHLGIREQLGAMDGGEVAAPAYNPERDAATGIRNAREIADYSVSLAHAIGAQLDAGRFPLVLGGDCSILLGSLLALHCRGRYGLLFLDGHHDLQTPQVGEGIPAVVAVGEFVSGDALD